MARILGQSRHWTLDKMSNQGGKSIVDEGVRKYKLPSNTYTNWS